MNIVLIGYKSCGKTSTGQALARRLRLAFVDLDRVFEDLFYRRFKVQCHYREPFEIYGEALFREVESAALAELIGRDGIVLATGGGAPMTPANRPVLKRLGTVVYLRVRPEVLYERFQRSAPPAFLQDDPSLARLTAHWQARDDVYAALADVTVDSSDSTPPRTAAAIARQLGKKTSKGSSADCQD